MSLVLLLFLSRVFCIVFLYSDFLSRPQQYFIHCTAHFGRVKAEHIYHTSGRRCRCRRRRRRLSLSHSLLAPMVGYSLGFRFLLGSFI